MKRTVGVLFLSLVMSCCLASAEEREQIGFEVMRSVTVGVTTPSPLTVTPPGEYALSIDGDFDLGGFVFKEGFSFLHTDGGATYGNVALGRNALISLTPGLPTAGAGGRNVALGAEALQMTTSGSYNTAVGTVAMQLNTTGYRNSAVGVFSLNKNDNGNFNTAHGNSALFYNSSGDANTAMGSSALAVTSSGNGNTAMGALALFQSTGSGNIALGYRSAYNLSSGDDNIFIGNEGLATENDTIRIGSGVHTQMFLGGVSGQVAGGSDAVYIGGNAKLGTTPASSRRFKEEIHDIGDLGAKLLDLRVVSFRYKPEQGHSAVAETEFGLIAEEVDQVLPEIVVYDENNDPLGVRYRQLVPLLLGEVQRQHRQNRVQWLLIAGMFLAGVVVVTRRGIG